jgi:hypothetical protein
LDGGVATTGPATPPRIRVRRLLRGAGLAALVIAALLIALDQERPASSASTVASPSTTGPPVRVRRTPPASAPREAPGARSAELGRAGGAVPDGTTVFSDGVPGVANLDPALLGALRRAAADAAGAGVELHVDSGWRSRAYQAHLLQQAIATYGSAAEAARWVATPDTSAHVSGDAIDIGNADGTAWLSSRGAAYGLCRIYANEPWHWELRPEAADHGCPSMYADPTHDPRMRTR